MELCETCQVDESDPEYQEKDRAYWDRVNKRLDAAPDPNHLDPEKAWAEYIEQYPEADPDS